MIVVVVVVVVVLVVVVVVVVVVGRGGCSGSSSSSSRIQCSSSFIPFNRVCQIYLILSAILRKPSSHIALRASIFKPNFSVAFSNCFFQNFFGHPHCLATHFKM